MNWAFGDEREVSPGNYAKLLLLQDGWAIWSFDVSTGTYFAANKPAEGKRHPAPLGVQQAFYGETPFASVIIHTPRPFVHFRGQHLHSTFQYREVGARFMTDGTHETELASLDGRKLEVAVKSMPTERSYSKMVSEVGFFDMVGLLSVVAAVGDLRAHASSGKE